MDADNTEISPLEEQARKRQEKLKNLKRKHEENLDEKSENSIAAKLPTPKFRSYKPADEALAQHKLEKPSMGNVQEEVKDLLELAKKDMVIDQLDITSLAPRQPDWDLKRDVAKKLEKLQRRTQKAMAELIRERLKERQDLADIATGVDTELR